MTRSTNKEERPITARPKGRTFYTETSGLHHRRKALMRDGVEDVSDNFLEHDSGCFRAEPTCKD